MSFVASTLADSTTKDFKRTNPDVLVWSYVSRFLHLNQLWDKKMHINNHTLIPQEIWDIESRKSWVISISQRKKNFSDIFTHTLNLQTQKTSRFIEISAAVPENKIPAWLLSAWHHLGWLV